MNEIMKLGAEAAIAEILEKLARVEHKALMSFLKGGGKVSDTMRQSLGISRPALLRAKMGLGAERAGSQLKTSITGAGQKVRDAATRISRSGASGVKGGTAAVKAPPPGSAQGAFSNFPKEWGIKTNLPPPPQMTGSAVTPKKPLFIPPTASPNAATAVKARPQASTVVGRRPRA